MTIPVENLYYLLCYAWDCVDEGDSVAAGVEDCPAVADMLAHVLSRGVDTLIRRGISHGYQERNEVLRTVRGRINTMATATSGLMRQGLIACDFEEFVRDTPENRVLRATLERLHRIPTLDRYVKQRTAATIERMWGISPIRLDATSFRSIQLHRASGLYGFLLQICRLVLRLLLPDEREGSTRLRDLLQDEDAMARVFQAFLLNFFRRHRPTWRPRAEVIDWQAEALAPDRAADLAALPRMETDLTLFPPGRLIIADAKYYREALASKWQGIPKARSGHLYQLSAYLSHRVEQDSREVQGMLIYPDTTGRIDLGFRLLGREVRLRTLNLDQPWQAIERDALALVD